jgi:hypothetical protein
MKRQPAAQVPDPLLGTYLGALDRGEIVSGRILQVVGDEWVHLALGPRHFWARAAKGRPPIGVGELEVLVPGAAPVLRLRQTETSRGIDLLVDPGWEKAWAETGMRVDSKA